jgi:hypothetical protein
MRNVMGKNSMTRLIFPAANWTPDAVSRDIELMLRNYPTDRICSLDERFFLRDNFFIISLKSYLYSLDNASANLTL